MAAAQDTGPTAAHGHRAASRAKTSGIAAACGGDGHTCPRGQPTPSAVGPCASTGPLERQPWLTFCAGPRAGGAWHCILPDEQFSSTQVWTSTFRVSWWAGAVHKMNDPTSSAAALVGPYRRPLPDSLRLCATILSVSRDAPVAQWIRASPCGRERPAFEAASGVPCSLGR